MEKSNVHTHVRRISPKFLVLFISLFLIQNRAFCDLKSISEYEVLKPIDTGIKGIKEVNPKNFKKLVKGKMSHLYYLKNESGTQVAITNFGARIVGLWVKDRDNRYRDVVVGLGTVDGFIGSSEPFFGATIGRFANRIAGGTFELEGKRYQLPKNNGKNTLHGGPNGFHNQVWTRINSTPNQLELYYLSKDGEEGFPGNLKVWVTYTLTEDNKLKIDFKAITDKTCPVNLTNHAFFNLNGIGSGDILGHFMKIQADLYTPVNEDLIPTGKLDSVKNTPFDFRSMKPIHRDIANIEEQLQFGQGFDHNFVLRPHTLENSIATVVGDQSGIRMDVFTEEPGLQFYSGNFMKSKNALKGGHKDEFRTAFALETQHFPDSPNQPQFPSTLLKPGEEYHTETIYAFSVWSGKE